MIGPGFCIIPCGHTFITKHTTSKEEKTRRFQVWKNVGRGFIFNSKSVLNMSIIICNDLHVSIETVNEGMDLHSSYARHCGRMFEARLRLADYNC